MSTPEETTAGAELLSALSVVEQQPLADRAEGYVKLYDQLRTQLEGDTPIARDQSTL